MKSLSQLDCLVLDIDGVVLDVSRSFRVVICATTQYVATKLFNLEDTGPLLELPEVDLFKMAGGFNSDWDLTNAAVLLVLAKQLHSGATDTAAVRAAAPSWIDFTSDIKRRGGGVVNAEAVILDLLTPHQRRDFANHWNPKLVTQLFQEMYAGDEACPRLYGFSPEHIHGPGHYQEEQVILDRDLLPKSPKLGVVTGRTRNEAELALQVAGLRERIPLSSCITEDDGVRKPDGRTLLMLRDRLDFRYAIYVGDTMDDLRTVHNYRELKGSGKSKIISCIALSGPSGAAHRRLFLEAGAEIVAPDTNSLLQYLGNVLK